MLEPSLLKAEMAGQRDSGKTGALLSFGAMHTAGKKRVRAGRGAVARVVAISSVSLSLDAGAATDRIGRRDLRGLPNLAWKERVRQIRISSADHDRREAMGQMARMVLSRLRGVAGGVEKRCAQILAIA